MGGSIIKADGLDKNSVRLDKTLRNWIGSMDEAQRKQFVNVLFQLHRTPILRTLTRCHLSSSLR